MQTNIEIEEMTTEVYETLMLEAECPLSGMDCAIIADLLVRRKGYHKASEVAREIFAEIERNMVAIDDADFNCFFNRFRVIGARTFAELKAKYLEVED